MRPYILAESTWEEVRRVPFEVAVLPWGATEAHNRHLPYGTDTIQSDAIAAASARYAWDRGARLVVLPAIPFGVQTGQLEVPLCLNMNPTTQLAVLRDLLPALRDHGVKKLVILNGHGGNEFRPIIRELAPQAGLFVCLVNWYACLPASEYFTEPGDHAGELETSVMQHIAPGLVRPLSDAGPGAARPFRIPALREGWAWAPRHWSEVTDDTGVGNPSASTPEKGERFFTAVAARIGEFLVDLTNADPADMYA